MVNSKFIRLYQSITEGERRLLKKWIYSPIHNQHKDIQKLFEYLFTRDSLTSVTLKKERAFNYIFGEEDYDMYKLNHLISYAYNTLEDFIEYLEAVEDGEKIKKNKIVAYHKRNLPKLAKQSLEKAIQQLSAKQHQNASFYYNAYQLEELKFEIEGPQQRNKDNNLPQLFQHVSDFFAITTLRYACIAATHSNVFNTAYDIPMMEAIINQIKIGKAAPVAVLYYYAYMALSKSEEEHYYTSLKEHFEKYGNLLPNKERRDILLITINYAIKRSHTGQLFYIQESLDLYKLGLETQLLLEDGELSRFAYKNIVALGLKLEDYDWTKYFITTYSPFLPIEVRQNYQDYVTAKYWFANKIMANV